MSVIHTQSNKNVSKPTLMGLEGHTPMVGLKSGVSVFADEDIQSSQHLQPLSKGFDDRYLLSISSSGVSNGSSD